MEAYPAISVAEDAPTSDVSRLIAKSDSGVVCVTCDGLPVGTITDQELLSSATALGREFDRLQAKHVMARIATTIDSRADASDLIDAVVLLRRAKAGNAIIVEDGRPVGVISVEALWQDDLPSNARSQDGHSSGGSSAFWRKAT